MWIGERVWWKFDLILHVIVPFIAANVDIWKWIQGPYLGGNVDMDV